MKYGATLMAAAGLCAVVKDRSMWTAHPRRRWRFRMVFLLFALVQLEYAWHTLLYSQIKF